MRTCKHDFGAVFNVKTMTDTGKLRCVKCGYTKAKERGEKRK